MVLVAIAAEVAHVAVEPTRSALPVAIGGTTDTAIGAVQSAEAATAHEGARRQQQAAVCRLGRLRISRSSSVPWPPSTLPWLRPSEAAAAGAQAEAPPEPASANEMDTKVAVRQAE
eukprot:7993088-Pyramimonas_sp.AAC.1